MEELKVHTRHVILWAFKNKKNTTETVSQISRVYGQGVITDCRVQNWFSKFCSGETSFRDEPRPGRSSDLDQDALNELVEWNLCKVLKN